MSHHNPNRPKVPEALALVPAWHAERTAKQFDPLHSLMENCNCGDSCCVVERSDMPASKALGDVLLQMSKSQRGRVANRHLALIH